MFQIDEVLSVKSFDRNLVYLSPKSALENVLNQIRVSTMYNRRVSSI